MADRFNLQEISGVGPGNAAGAGRSDLPAANSSNLVADGDEGAAAPSWGGLAAAAHPLSQRRPAGARPATEALL